ncbi:hypothetical protein TNCV_3876651 [Trichonephila clavipes]|uniref:Uncharacterized protein n=1 Tax=Trichonephila clavipes TaxID=2585209 RepID=A0A8X6SS47_TRICX|nr:hypothetical protein TNCV_3876651 [Trichonephila clavipes]
MMSEVTPYSNEKLALYSDSADYPIYCWPKCECFGKSSSTGTVDNGYVQQTPQYSVGPSASVSENAVPRTLFIMDLWSRRPSGVSLLTTLTVRQGILKLNHRKEEECFLVG